MSKSKFDRWCEAATGQIRYKPDRKEVSKELMAHLEEAYDACVSQGHSHADAERMALTRMGNADEIAPQLAKLHKPWLGYLYTLTKFCAISLAAFALFLWISSGVSLIHNWISARNFDYLPANYNSLDYYAHPRVHDSSDGLYFEVAEAGYSKASSTFYFQLDILHLPEMRSSNVISYIWAIDSNGNYYASRSEAEYREIPKVTIGGGSSSALISHCSMEISGFDCTAQWVELHYDRDGRDVVLRIDLGGGEAA